MGGVSPPHVHRRHRREGASSPTSVGAAERAKASAAERQTNELFSMFSRAKATLSSELVASGERAPHQRLQGLQFTGRLGGVDFDILRYSPQDTTDSPSSLIPHHSTSLAPNRPRGCHLQKRPGMSPPSKPALDVTSPPISGSAPRPSSDAWRS